MITVTTTILSEEMRNLALSNCLGTPKETNNSIVFKMTDRMFKPFWQQAKLILGYSKLNDNNFIFKFHDDKYPLLDWK